MARMTAMDNGILPCQEAFLVDAPHPETSPRRWIQAKVIRQVGNYNEIFEGHLVPVGLTREGGSPNASWRDGGLIYAPPAR